jgi:hypothetical protein
MLTLNQYIDQLTPAAQRGDRAAQQKIDRLRAWKLRHPYSGRQKINVKSQKPASWK